MLNSLPNKKLLALLFAGVLMGALDIAIIGPALPAIRSEYLIDLREGSWIFNIYLLLYLLSAPLMAKLSDSFGRRKIYVLDIALFAVGSLIISVSNDFSILLFGRAIQGLGAGGIFPVASAVIGDTIPKEKQGIALGMIGMVFGLAFILGPIIGGMLLMYDWRWIFLINIPIAVAIIFATYSIMPKDINRISHKFDILGLSILVIILTSFSYGLNSIDANRFNDSLFSLDVFPFLLISMVLVPAFWEVEHRAENPIIQPSMLKKKQLIIAYFIGFGAGICESAAMYAPQLAKQNFNVSDSKASFMLIPMVLTMLVASPISGALIDKKGTRTTLMFGTIVSTVSLLLLSLFSQSILGFYIGGGLLGFGLSFLLGAPLRYIINNELDKEHRAVGQSVVSLSTTTGQILSVALIGGVISSFGSSYTGFQIALGMLVLVGLLMFLSSTQLRKR